MHYKKSSQWSKINIQFIVFLQKLELQGFKSFAPKTTLDFKAGITAIVGPNGSGKSNVVDAIKWLLGEREAKSLRGGRADDLIFAGSGKKPRHGLAKASIYFDNSSGIFPTEFQEVIISRRISRDGQSVFLLNQAEVKLKDIVNFFAKTKLGARGLNIISQGESDSFLKITPLERRERIEEILGLKEYILKKNTSVRELKNTIFNLEKAQAMIEELKPRLRMLRRQVSRYHKREEIESELKNLETNYFGHKVKAINEEINKFEPVFKEKEKIILRLRQELETAEKNFKKIEASEPRSRQELESIRREKRELFERQIKTRDQSSINKDHREPSDPLVLIGEIKSLAENALGVVSIEEIKNLLKKIIFLVDGFKKEKKAQAAPVLPESASLNQFRHLLDGLEEREGLLTKELEEFNKIFRETLRLVEAKKDEIQEVEEIKNKILFEKERTRFHLEELTKQILAIGKKPEDFANYNVLSTQEEINEEGLEKRMQRLRAELAAIGDVDEALVKESEEAEGRFEFLEHQIKDLTKASSDLRELIKELDSKVHYEFALALQGINQELKNFVKLMFGAGRAALKLESAKPLLPENAIQEDSANNENFISTEKAEEKRPGIEVEVNLSQKGVKGIETLSGGERSLLAIAILFALMSISPPPFIVLDEIDAALDERNTRRFGELLKRFAVKTQFIVVTHNRTTMEVADILYGVTMGGDGISKVVSLKLT